MKTPFKTVGLIARRGSRSIVESVATLEQFLLTRDVAIVFEAATAAMLPNCPHRKEPRKALGDVCDLLIVVGGDGSLLGVARDLAASQVPVIGVNRGGLGFLADISPDQIEPKIGAVLDGQFTVDHRFMLEAEVFRDGKRIGGSAALNDVVVHAGTMSRMMEFALHIDDKFVYDQRSDGLIVATPTGSTAYALSAGGPIMHPRLDAIVVVPMFPHTLTSRPLVVPSASQIKVIVGSTTSKNQQISCDSQVDIGVAPGDEIHIRKYAHELKLLYSRDHSFYEACRSKLDWASRLGGRIRAD
jgi:NAD+ kinase